MAPSSRKSSRNGPATKPRRGQGPSRAARRAGTREQIRVAAWELFSTVGFDETTTNAIAKRAGVAAGTVFVHASDKADLLFMIMRDRLEAAVKEGFETIDEGPLIERFMHLFATLFRMYGEHPKIGAAFVRLLPGATGPNATDVNALTATFLHKVAALITEAKARGEVATNLDAMACAQNVFGLYFMALLTWLAGHASIDDALDPFLRSALTLQIRGFRP